MLRRLFHIALNPLFQSLIVAGIIILFVPLGIQKYKVALEEMTSSFDQSIFQFADLDHDGHSERIHTFFNEAGNVGIIIRRDGITDEQINFKGVFKKSANRLMMGDYNLNGTEEVYVFTLVQDSIMLNGIEAGNTLNHSIRDRFIAKTGKNLSKPDYQIIPGKVTDMTGDRSGDLVFAINTGFSRQPRNVFIYDIVKDSLHSSPESGAFINDIFLGNLDSDPFDEITVCTSATDNFMETPVAFSDSSSWLMVLDHTLEFLFPPVEFPGRTGNVNALPLPMAGSRPLLVGFAKYFPEQHLQTRYFISDYDGNLITNRIFEPDDPFSLMDVIPAIQGMDQDKLLSYVEHDGFYILDHNLNIEKISDAKFSRWKPRFIDLDLDGEDEAILISSDHSKHIIYRNDFSHPVEVDFPIQSQFPVISIKKYGLKPPAVSFQGDEQWRLYSYGINPVYRFRFLIYLGIYALILGFIVIIRKLYGIQLTKRYETEKKMAKLQLAGIKAQMEPHFIFNVINSIGSSIYRERKDEAYQLVLRFSNMVRALLASSDVLVRTLREETDFVANFLELEKIRFPELFNYTIETAEDVDRESLVPKMVMQLHAENALKHGLRPKGIEGLLEITVVKENEYLKISIRDNGVGREESGIPKADSTGKGMKLLGQFYETYNKHNKQSIRQEITDLHDAAGNPSGTLVEIWIPLDFNERIY